MAEAEAAWLRERVERPENRLERVRSEEFWDRVMREVWKILPAEGAMTPEEILPGLKCVTVRGAALYREPLTPVTLKQKMDVRVAHGRDFEPRDEGRYARKAG